MFNILQQTGHVPLRKTLSNSKCQPHQGQEILNWNRKDPGKGECRQAHLLPTVGIDLSLATVQRARSLHCVTSFSEQLASHVGNSPRDHLQLTVLLRSTPVILCYTVSLVEMLPDFHFKLPGSGFLDLMITSGQNTRQQKWIFLEMHRLLGFGSSVCFQGARDQTTELHPSLHRYF